MLKLRCSTSVAGFGNAVSVWTVTPVEIPVDNCALIGLYLEKSDAAGAFGPAGAVIVWLLWAVYSALIFLFSAELLYAISRQRHWRWAESGDIGANERGFRAHPEEEVPAE